MKQIIAMGGGGFSMEPDNLALDQYVLEQCGRSRPAICLLPTATGDSERAAFSFYAAFSTLDCQPSHLFLFDPPTADLASFLLEKDIIYVGGGNTRSMLALWYEWGIDEILRQAWQKGTVLAGISAGAICWFEQGVTDSVPGELGPLDCLGFLPGSCCPHFDGEIERRPAFHRLIKEKAIVPGYGLDDGAALHFIDQELKGVVSSRPGAKAYFLQIEEGEVRERPLESLHLVNPR